MGFKKFMRVASATISPPPLAKPLTIGDCIDTSKCKSRATAPPNGPCNCAYEWWFLHKNVRDYRHTQSARHVRAVMAALGGNKIASLL